METEINSTFEKLQIIYNSNNMCSELLNIAKTILFNKENKELYDYNYNTIKNNPNRWPKSHQEFINLCESCKTVKK